MEEIKRLVNLFEQKVIAAWVYDTKLEYVDVLSLHQSRKANALYDEVDSTKAELIKAIEGKIDNA